MHYQLVCATGWLVGWLVCANEAKLRVVYVVVYVVRYVISNARRLELSHTLGELWLLFS